MRRMYSENQIKELVDGQLAGKQDALTPTSVEDGTIAKAIGFDSDGDIVKGTISGGIQLYKHEFRLTLFDEEQEVFDTSVIVICQVISTKSTAFVRGDLEDGDIQWNFISIKGSEYSVSIEDDEEVREETGNAISNICFGDRLAYSPCVIMLGMGKMTGFQNKNFGFSGTLEDSVHPL